MRHYVQPSAASYWPGLNRPFGEDVCLPFLRGMQNSDGGWGFTPRAPSSPEPASWALLALARWPQPESSLRRGIVWLEQTQLSNGAWPAHGGGAQSAYVTALACLALHNLEAAQESVARGAGWLCGAFPAEAGWARRVGLRLGASPPEAAFGWACAPGSESAVEPTAAAMLLLQNLTPKNCPRGAARRMKYARRFLCHALLANPGADSDASPEACTPAYAAAWALLALRDDSHRLEFQDRLDWLHRAAAASRGPATLALAQMALRACGRRPDWLDGRLARLHANNQFLNQVPVVAAASIAVSPPPRWTARQPMAAAMHGRVLLRRV